MILISIKPKNRIEGTSIFNILKERVLNILEGNDLDSYVTLVIKEPSTNAWRVNFKKNQAKTKQIIYDSVKDNVMPVITSLKTAKECFDTLTNQYKNKAPSQNRELKNKLWSLKMEKDETVASLFTKISQVRDQIVSIRVMVDEYDLL